MRKPIISSPAPADARIKLLLHGSSGVGKTRFASSFPAPLIFDFETGTSSVSLPGVQVVASEQFKTQGVFNPQTVIDYVQWLNTPEAKDIETVVLDSITELQEQFMAVTIPKKTDPRQAYGEWSSYVRTLMSNLRSLDKHFVVIARTKMGANFEGAEDMLLPQISPAAWTNVPSLVDFGLYMNQKKEGLGPTAKVIPVLVTASPNAWTKTRRPLPPEIKNATFATFQAAIQATNAAS